MKKLITFAAVCLIASAIYLPEAVSSNTGEKNSITFTKQIAPIFQKRCEECHRAGGMAPMPLATYEQSRPWARAIKEKVVSREMPPFHAAGAVGRYLNDPRLTDEEVATITKWVDGGATKGDPKDMPAPVQWKNDWTLGEPDLVVKPKQPYTIKASKQDQYVFFVFDYVFPEDTWIRSIVTRPGNLKAVHHANTHVVMPMLKAPESGYFEGDFEPSARGAIMVAGWAPGVQPVMLADGMAIRIPKGMRLGIQIHYAPAEKETVDQTEVGVYFANGLIKKHMKVMMGDRKDLSIPPNDPDYSLTSTKTFDTDAIIHFYHVHMHLRGKSYQMKLTYPDGREETTLEVPRYDFNWQRTYVLNQPVRAPKGTKVDFIGTYDNSAKNRFNPDPTKTVKWGEKTTDEMMQGRIFYESADENLNVRVKKGRVVTSSASAEKEYVCYRTAGKMVIDGKLDESSWRDAPATDAFVDIEGEVKPRPRFTTRAKMLWDDQYFYVGAEMEEPHAWATLTKRDSVIFHDNDFEVFIDPNGDRDEYYELEINALNTVWDLFLPKPYRDGGKAQNSWDIAGLKTAVKVAGTLNDPTDVDKGWSVEMAIPWKVLGEYAHKPAPPADGDEWRVNFSRVEWRHEIVEGKYRKIPDTKEDNWVWSPQGVVDMHRPEMWGLVRFSNAAAGKAKRKS